MINHARTLLLNVDGSNNPGPDFPGEELVPATYRALALPSYLVQVRSRLFGAAPDRVMLNYRLKQYLTVLHTTELVEYLLELDPRITYRYAGDEEVGLADSALFAPQLVQTAGPAARLWILGSPAAPDALGQLRYRYDLEMLLDTTVAVTRRVPLPAQQQIYPIALDAGGISNRVPLGATGLGFRSDTDNPGAAWRIEGCFRPQWDLGQIVANLRQLGEPILLELFGTSRIEPWSTFRNLWNDHEALAYQLGGLLMAVVYSTEAIRRG